MSVSELNAREEHRQKQAMLAMGGTAEHDEDAGLNATMLNENDNILSFSKIAWKERTANVLDATMSYNEAVC